MELTQHNSQIQNLGQAERVASILAGGALGYYGLREALAHHSIAGAGLALAGAALLKRGITGYCEFYRALGVDRLSGRPGANASISYRHGIRIDRSVTINVSRETVYSFWRKLENLPSFSRHVRAVKTRDNTHSHWVMDGPAGQLIEWDAEIINDIPNELLAWRSLPGASIDNAGAIRFDHATAGRGTKVTVSLQYNPPGGKLGAVFAKLLGKNPESEVESELCRLKSILETGEIPTSEGQPTGRTDDAALREKEKLRRQDEEVDRTSEESFPGSDAPSYSHVNNR